MGAGARSPRDILVDLSAAFVLADGVPGPAGDFDGVIQLSPGHARGSVSKLDTHV